MCCVFAGLRNKREIWRVGLAVAKVRAIGRALLTLPVKVPRSMPCWTHELAYTSVNSQDPKRIFEGEALLRRLTRMGILSESEQKLDYVLGLTVEKFLDRRLQSRVFSTGLAKSIHHARVLIRQRHIRYAACHLLNFLFLLLFRFFNEFAFCNLRRPRCDVTSALVSVWSTFPLSLFVWRARSTSSLLLPVRLVVVAMAVLNGSDCAIRPPAVMMKPKLKLTKISNSRMLTPLPVLRSLPIDQ